MGQKQLQRISTSCFSAVPDKRPEIAAAHFDPTINAITSLVLQHPMLMEDLSTHILGQARVILPGERLISDIYRDRELGVLRPDQEQLAHLLDKLYATQDEKLLGVLRGILLERIVRTAVEKRKLHPPDDVVDNVRDLRKAGRDGPHINQYSVDVAACLPSHGVIELYACKLQSEYMLGDHLAYLDQLGEYFSKFRKTITAFCCLEKANEISHDFSKTKSAYEWIYLVTADTLAKLQFGNPDEFGGSESEDT